MKRFFNYISVLSALLIFFCYTANAQNIQVQARVDRVSIPIGDQTVLHIIAHVQAKDEIDFPKITDSIAGKLQIVRTAKPDTTFDKNNLQNETITQNYTLTSFTAGTYTIPAYTLHTKTAAYTTDSLTFEVTTVHVDTTKAIYDIKQPLTVNYNFWDWLRDNWYWVVGPLAIIALIIGIIYYIRKRPKTGEVIKAEPALPPHTIALNKLFELRDKKLWQADEVKLYYSELTDVLRDYLEKRYQVKAHEQTTDEIFTALRLSSMPKDVKNKLRELLVLADLVKFAKERPLPEENELSMDSAINFITLTKPEAPSPIQKEELPK